MSLKWTDTQAIAEALYDTHPEIDPRQVRFTDLLRWVMALEEFDDDESRCGERILEGIQMAWINEVGG